MRILEHKRLIAGVIVVLGIVAAAMWPESIEVNAAKVERGPLQVTLDEDGETRVRERFVVSAPVAGRLQRIELEPGDRVVRGKTVVARLSTADAPLLDPRTRVELQAAVEAARAAVGQAQSERDRSTAELTRARTTLERQRQLMKAGAIASDTLDAAETAVATAEEASKASVFAVSRSEHELQLARARLQAPAPAGRSVEVVAPVNGVILKRLRESESVVPVGEPLIEIGDPARIEIVADFLSTDAVRVQQGALVLIDGWGGSDPLQGRVRRVEPAGFMKVSALGVEEQRVNVLIDFDDPAAAGRLGDGYRVEVRVVMWSEPDVVKVPVGGLFRRGDAWAAFVIDGDLVRLQP
ncbi:MAG TPA: HlyD family efflux transporter periplasmic adaptor subunit, partial [Vicinamibacterales bacterium]|nr:HlyD family efflux transporter periplasmic adaptor subunit [Vicinamibacterales bacterium]